MSLLQILTALAAIIGMFLREQVPWFPFTDAQILAAMLFLLGLIGVVPQVWIMLKYKLKRGLTGTEGWLKSKALWEMVAGIASIILLAYFPNLPITPAMILAFILFALNQAGINPEIKRLWKLVWLREKKAE